MEATDPLLPFFFTCASNYLRWIVLDLDFEAVLEYSVSLVPFEVSLFYRVICNLCYRDLVEGVLRDAFNTDFLYKERLDFHVEI